MAQPWSAGFGTVGQIWPNFAPAHDATTARRAYRPATLARLREIAEKYDPAQVFPMGSAIRA